MKQENPSRPTFTVVTDPNTPEDKFVGIWLEKWRDHISYFDNEGCECCINIYNFAASAEALEDLPADWLSLYQEGSQLPRRTQNHS